MGNSEGIREGWEGEVGEGREGEGREIEGGRGEGVSTI